MVIYGIIIACRRIKPVPANRKEVFGVLGRAVAGAISITCSYCCLRLIPLGDATSIRFSLPIWTLIIGYFWLGESCSLVKVGAVVVTVSGVVLIAKPDDCIYLMHWLFYELNLESGSQFAMHADEHRMYREREFQKTYIPSDHLLVMSASAAANDNNIIIVDAADAFANATTTPAASLMNGIGLNASDNDALVEELISGATAKHFRGCLLALASSVCLSISLISLRFCKKTPVEVTILWLSVSCILVGTATLITLGEWNMPDNLRDVLYIILNGFCGAIGQWFITSALKIEQSGMIALARTFDIEVAFLYSALLLHEQIRATR